MFRELRWILQSRKSLQHFSHPMEESGHHIGDLTNASRKECPSEDRICGAHPAARPVSLRGEQQERSCLCRDVCFPSIYSVTGMASTQHSLYRILFGFTTTLLSLYQEDRTLERVSDLPRSPWGVSEQQSVRVGKACAWREHTSGTGSVTDGRRC